MSGRTSNSQLLDATDAAQERRRAEETESWLAAIVEHADDAIIGKDLNGIITSWNRGAERIFGYSAAEAVGRSITILIPPDRLQEESEILQRLRRRERIEHYETVRRRKDGTLLQVSLSISPVTDASGRIIGASKIARDITKTKRAEEALRQSEERKSAIIDSAFDAILTLDSQGKINGWNRSAETMFGYPTVEALGRNMDELIIPADRRQFYHDQLGEYLATGVGSLLGRPFELALKRADGQELCGEVAITPHSRDEPTEYTCIVRDVTARKRAEQVLRESEARLARANEELESKVQESTAELREKIVELEGFSYTLSHDMRAPLRAMRSFSQIVLAEYGEKLGASARDLLQRVTDAAERLDHLIQDVLAFSRLSRQEFNLEIVEVEKLLRHVIHERPEFQPPRADIVIQSPLLPVKGHEASLTQCITNLLDNAVKFVERGTQPHVVVRSETVGDEVRIWFEDNGIGIEKDAQARLFGTFQPHDLRVYPGSGIGLAIARKAAGRMKGGIGVESEPGKGSRFWLQLPRGLHS